MITMGTCKDTNELADRLKRMSMMAIYISYHASELSERLYLGQAAYNPYDKKSLGKLTEKLEGLALMGNEMGNIANSI